MQDLGWCISNRLPGEAGAHLTGEVLAHLETGTEITGKLVHARTAQRTRRLTVKMPNPWVPGPGPASVSFLFFLSTPSNLLNHYSLQSLRTAAATRGFSVPPCGGSALNRHHLPESSQRASGTQGPPVRTRRLRRREASDLHKNPAEPGRHNAEVRSRLTPPPRLPPSSLGLEGSRLK